MDWRPKPARWTGSLEPFGGRRADFILPAWENGGKPADLTRGLRGTLIDTMGWTRTRYGIGLDHSANAFGAGASSTHDVVNFGIPAWRTGSAITVLWFGYKGTGVNGFMISRAEGASYDFGLYANGATPTQLVFFYGANLNVLFSALTMANESWNAVGVSASAGARIGCVNGAIQTGAGITLVDNNRTVVVGSRKNGSNYEFPWDGYTLFAAVLPYAMSRGELQAWSRDPFAPIRQPFAYVAKVPAAGGATVPIPAFLAQRRAHAYLRM